MNLSRPAMIVTGAISEDGVNTQKCLRSYMNRLDDMPEEDYPNMGRRIMGCDTCQSVCPKNVELKREQPPADLIDCMKLEKLLTDPELDRISKYFQLHEPGVKPLAALAAANTGRKDLLPVIETLIGNEDKILDKIAKWVCVRLRQI